MRLIAVLFVVALAALAGCRCVTPVEEEYVVIVPDDELTPLPRPEFPGDQS